MSTLVVPLMSHDTWAEQRPIYDTSVSYLRGPVSEVIFAGPKRGLRQYSLDEAQRTLRCCFPSGERAVQCKSVK